MKIKTLLTTAVAALMLAMGNLHAAPQWTPNAPQWAAAGASEEALWAATSPADAAGTAPAATNAPAAPAWYQPALDIGSDIINATNISVNPFGTVLVSGAKSGKVGGGVIALYNVSGYLGAGIGVYYLGAWSEFSGNIQLQLPTHPLSGLGWTNFTVTPFTLDGIGTPLSGAGTANGSISVIATVGANVDLYSFSDGWTIGLGGAYGTVTDAGPYSGNIVSAFLSVRRGF